MLRRFFAFWYDFIVGDDWLLAVGVVAALVLTALALRAQLEPIAWLIMPLGAMAILTASLARAVR